MELLLLTTDPTSTTVLPAVHLLPVKLRSAAPEPASLVTAGPYDLLLLDARHDLAAARTLCRRLAADGLAVPILAPRRRTDVRVDVGRDYSTVTSRPCRTTAQMTKKSRTMTSTAHHG